MLWKYCKDLCISLKSVLLSSRDPALITPVVKSMLRAKPEFQQNVYRLRVINQHISQCMKENHQNLAVVIGSRD